MSLNQAGKGVNMNNTQVIGIMFPKNCKDSTEGLKKYFRKNTMRTKRCKILRSLGYGLVKVSVKRFSIGTEVFGIFQK